MTCVVRAIFVASFLIVSSAFDPVKWDFTGELHLEYKKLPRLYHLILPRNYHESEQIFPAVLFLHGNGANASAFASETNMTQEGPKNGYIMIFAEGVQTPDSNPSGSRERSWNSGTCCDEALTNNVDDITYLKTVLQDITHRRFRINRQKVFISGTSNGGSLTVRATCELGREYFAGASANVGSFEGRSGADCGKKCIDHDDGYRYCEWDRNKKGCQVDDWYDSLPSIYDCEKQLRHPAQKPVPIIFFNGRLDPSSNISGLVVTPINNSAPGVYNETFPPMDFIYPHFARLYGCDMKSLHRSFHNGTTDNATTCYSWSSCPHAANVTYCLSDAGHQWYGDNYDYPAVCEYEGYNKSECDPTVALADYGPNTPSVSDTQQTLAFFERLL
jgi:poly(3-hydroxybutyrate) depolymerase